MPSNTKPCHNCRRRRLRCDRSWPTCHKCAFSGQECLGYGQLFVWTQAIDSNPKTAASANRNGIVGQSKKRSIGVPSPTLASTASAPLMMVPTDLPHYDGVEASHMSSLSQPDAMDIDMLPQTGPKPQAVLADDPEPTQGERRASPPQPPMPAAMAALIDPLFKDLDYNSRYYLAHFADRVCQDLVARDEPASNPFRQLIPLANKHPLLLEVLVATSAMHWSNIFRPREGVPTALHNLNDYQVLLRDRDLVSRSALIDALAAKQRAMGHLRVVLETLDPAGSEVVLAAMHFFVKFDLIDMERTEAPSWKTHLEGACSILSLLTPHIGKDPSHRMLRDCVMADCFIYHILGSTLASGALAARIARYAFDLLPVMKRVESNGYLSCPPEILQIILQASKLSHDYSSTDRAIDAASEALDLYDQAMSFNISLWATNLQIPNPEDMDSRIHMASAHRSAACLYILQALPLIRHVKPVDTDSLVNDIMGHLSLMTEDDPFFKATAWPTFIAGAETRDGVKRTWALRRLLAIWKICPWGYIFTAIEMLKAAWEMQDDERNRGGDGVTVNWLQGLKRRGFDYLIV